MAALLAVHDVEAGYGATPVLKGISLTVEEGEALAVLGANGAGKTTLMKAIAGLVRPRAGTIEFDGEEITTVAPDKRPALGIGLAPEGREIFTTLSIEENLRIGGSALRRRFGAAEAKERIAAGLERVYRMFPVLGERRHDRGSNLSGGQQQMLAIGRALIAEPKLLMFDEPCLGLAPKIGNEVYGVLHRLREEGQSLIVVEESSRRALEFVDRACVIKLGEKVMEDRAEAMKGDRLLLEAYFGISEEGEGEGRSGTEDGAEGR